MSFAPYDPQGSPRPPPKKLLTQLKAHFKGDGELASIAQVYARGALKDAIRQAQRLKKNRRGVRRRRVDQLESSLKKISKAYDRTRTEISNDPDRAWSMLISLTKTERKVLPESVESFVVRELEVSLSEAFASRGRSLFDRGRYEEAFQRWQSGFKLDVTNPAVLAGLDNLERTAEQLAQETELATQRGDRDVCDRWKRITRMTRSTSEIHKRARERAFSVCR